jgi:hypothetical protein
VINDHLRRCKRINLLRVSPKLSNCLTHGREIHYTWNTSEVLHNHPGRSELDLFTWLGLGIPVCQFSDVILGYVFPILSAEKILQQNVEAVRQFLSTCLVYVEVAVFFAGYIEFLFRIEAVSHDTPYCFPMAKSTAFVKTPL